MQLKTLCRAGPVGVARLWKGPRYRTTDGPFSEPRPGTPLSPPGTSFGSVMWPRCQIHNEMPGGICWRERGVPPEKASLREETRKPYFLPLLLIVWHETWEFLLPLGSRGGNSRFNWDAEATDGRSLGLSRWSWSGELTRSGTSLPLDSCFRPADPLWFRPIGSVVIYLQPRAPLQSTMLVLPRCFPRLSCHRGDVEEQASSSSHPSLLWVCRTLVPRGWASSGPSAGLKRHSAEALISLSHVCLSRLVVLHLRTHQNHADVC